MSEELDAQIQRAADRMRDDWDHAITRLLGAWDTITNEQRTELVRLVREAVDADNVEALSNLDAPVDAASDLLAGFMVDMSSVGAGQITQEASEQGQQVEPVTVGENVLRPIAAATAILLATGLSAAVGREAMRIWGPTSTSTEVAAGVDEFVKNLPERGLRDQLGGALTNAQNRGRFATLLTAPPATWYATERNDSNACGPCRDIDDHQFNSLQDANAAYPNGGYINCKGGVRCRGSVVPVWESEELNAV